MSPPDQHVSRRQFLGAAGPAAAAFSALSLPARGYAEKVLGGNDRIRIGFIGAGTPVTRILEAIKSLRQKNNLEPVIVADCWRKRAEEGAGVVGTRSRRPILPPCWTARTSTM